MRPQDKNLMQRNLRHFLNYEMANEGLYDNQEHALEAVEKFMGLPNGSDFTQFSYDDEQETGIKKGDYFEVVSATGSGKTRTLGTMAKAMDVPTLIISPRNILSKQAKKTFCEEIGVPTSEVAVFDSKQKVAERRRVLQGDPPPKFVITTYQSLPSLINRHGLDIDNPDDKHYRPLVILDEVHEAQGEETAKIINRLKEKVLVAGFTATDGGASQTLFNGQAPIYKMPLVQAIKRGISCKRVRTGVIDVAIDEDWVNNFIKTPKGKDFKKEDVERFARTPSVIEGAVQFHLTKVDDELGRIGRLPTVFYTEGVDAARDGAKKFNEYAEKMGLSERAAYVSGAMGEKEYGPILEDFKAGKIQAVFNDKLLGMGFDAKNATVCYSLKPSNMLDVVEQQLGRICRKQGPDYYAKYGMDKVALAINVRAKGTRPRLFGQVLGAPAIDGPDYTPSFIPDGNGGYSSPYITWPDGMEVHLDYHDMEAVIADSEKYQTRYLTKGDWLSTVDADEVYVGGVSKIKLTFEKFREGKIKSLMLNDIPQDEAETIVERDWIGMRYIFPVVASCASPAAIAEMEANGVLRSKRNKAPPKEENWLSNAETTQFYVGGDGTFKSIFEAFRQDKINAFIANGLSSEEAEKIVEHEWIGNRSVHTKEAICASPVAIAEMKANGLLRSKETKAPPKENWTSSTDAKRKYVGGESAFKSNFEVFREKKIKFFIADGMLQDEAKKIVERDWIAMRNSAGKDNICASPTAIVELETDGILRSITSKAPPKENWASNTDAGKIYVGGSTKFKLIFETFRMQKIEAFVTAGMPADKAQETVERDWMGMRNSGTTESICASPLALADLEKNGTLQRRDVVITKESPYSSNDAGDTQPAITAFADKVGKRDITTGSSHLKRTGRIRAKVAEPEPPKDDD